MRPLFRLNSTLIFMLSLQVSLLPLLVHAGDESPLQMSVTKRLAQAKESCVSLLSTPEAANQIGFTALTALKERSGEFSNANDKTIILRAQSFTDPSLGNLSQAGRERLEIILDEELEYSAITQKQGLTSVPSSSQFRKAQSPAMREFKRLMDLKAWSGAIDEYQNRFSESERSTLYFSQQFALALNKRNGPGDRAKAIETLNWVLATYGSSGETHGLIGAIYKNYYYEQIANRAHDHQSLNFLDQAIHHYRQGYILDIQNYYPGINLINLLAEKGSPEANAEIAKLVPVVRMAVEISLRSKPDFWGYGTLLQLDLLLGDTLSVSETLGHIQAIEAPSWFVETTLKDLYQLRTRMRKKSHKDLLQKTLITLESYAAALNEKEAIERAQLLKDEN